MPSLASRLLLVTDRQQTRGRPLLDVLTSALAAGVRAVQLRERDLSSRELLRLAQEVQRLTTAAGAQLLINDRADVAMTLDGVGVHLRANSLPVATTRKLLGGQRLIGISTTLIISTKAIQDFVEMVRELSPESKVVLGGPTVRRDDTIQFTCKRAEKLF